MTAVIDLNRFQPQSDATGVTLDGPKPGPLGEGTFRLATTADGGIVSLGVDAILSESFQRGRFVVFDVYHEQPYTLGILLNFEGCQGSSTPSIHATLGVLPGLVTRVSFPLSALDGQTIFLPRTPGRLKGTCFGTKVDPTEIAVISIGLPAASKEQEC